MKHVICNFCGSDRPNFRYALHDIRLDLPGEYNLVECQQCGLLYLDPQPTWEELEPHYNPSQNLRRYHGYVEAPQDQRSKFVRWVQEFGLHWRCQAVTRRVQTGQLLDVGCATGVFLNAMQSLTGWKVAGVEPVLQAAQYAREHFGLEVYPGTLPEAGYADQRFDVVTLWDVLEHAAQPAAYLQEVYRILKPGGWLVLKIPDPSGWEAHWFGSNWVGYEAPQHLYGFPRPVITRKLKETGFGLIQSGSTGGDYAAFMVSLSAFSSSHGWVRLSPLLRRLAASTLARVGSAPLFYGMRRVGLRSSMTYFARKVA
jgi:SAM-dependent methyltransferase